MHVAVTIDPRDPHRDSVRDDAEWCLGKRARSGWRVREDDDGREVLTFEFRDSLDAVDFSVRCAPYEHRGRLS